MMGSKMLQSLIRSQSFLKPSALKSVRCPVRMCYQAAPQSGVHAGNVAVMTASTYGIEFAIARRLAQQGVHGVLSSRKQENVDRAIEDLKKENLEVSGIVCDDGKKEDRKNLGELALENHGGIDYSNATYTILPKNILETSEEESDEVLEKHGRTDYLFKNVAYKLLLQNVLDMPEDEWDEELEDDEEIGYLFSDVAYKLLPQNVLDMPEEQWDEALDKNGEIDYPFPNAAYNLLPKNVLDTSEEECDEALENHGSIDYLFKDKAYLLLLENVLDMSEEERDEVWENE